VLDVGAGEVVGLAVVALVVVGPEKLPRYAADAARLLRRLRRMASDARDEVTRELGPELDGLDLGDLKDLRDLDPRRLVRRHLLEPMEADDDDVDAGREAGGTGNGSAPRRTPGSAAPGYEEDVT